MESSWLALLLRTWLKCVHAWRRYGSKEWGPWWLGDPGRCATRCKRFATGARRVVLLVDTRREILGEILVCNIVVSWCMHLNGRGSRRQGLESRKEFRKWRRNSWLDMWMSKVTASTIVLPLLSTLLMENWLWCWQVIRKTYCRSVPTVEAILMLPCLDQSYATFFSTNVCMWDSGTICGENMEIWARKVNSSILLVVI